MGVRAFILTLKHVRYNATRLALVGVTNPAILLLVALVVTFASYELIDVRLKSLLFKTSSSS